MSEPNDYGIVADLYDTYVPATFDIPFFLEESKKWSGEVLELMSGTGRVSLPLVEAGIKLTCVDRSAQMLAILRDKLAQRGLSANLHQADVCELDLGKQFDIVFIPFHSFAEIVSPDDQRKALARIRQHLSPNGCFICTLRNAAKRPPSDGKLCLNGKYPLGDAGTLLFWFSENRATADPLIIEALEFFEEYDAKGVLTSKRLLELKFRLIVKAEFQELVESAGFRVEALYGDYDHSEFHEESSRFMIWQLVLRGRHTAESTKNELVQSATQ